MTGFSTPVIARIIATNSYHHPLCKSYQVRQFAYPVVYQRYIGSLDGYVASYASHGYSHKGFFQSRCIVYTVADHAHLTASVLILFDAIQLIFRKTFGVYSFYTEPFSYVLRRFLTVSGHKYGNRFRDLYLRYRILRISSQRVRQCEKSCDPARYADVYYGTAPV